VVGVAASPAQIDFMHACTQLPVDAGVDRTLTYVLLVRAFRSILLRSSVLLNLISGRDLG